MPVEESHHTQLHMAQSGDQLTYFLVLRSIPNAPKAIETLFIQRIEEWLYLVRCQSHIHRTNSVHEGDVIDGPLKCNNDDG